jgi:hypothetical protein
MAMTERERQKQAEQDVTDFGIDRNKFRESLTETRTENIYRGTNPDSREKIGEREVSSISRENQARLEAAELNFENQGGTKSVAEAQSRGGSGGSFASQGDFGPGAIRLNTVTPVNSKVRGR